MAPFLYSLLQDVSTAHLIDEPESLLVELRAKNKTTLDTLAATLLDAQTNLGETEISDALKAQALYLARIGEKVGFPHSPFISFG